MRLQPIHTDPKRRRHRRTAAFTLLEVIIAMGVLALLLTGIFQVAKSTMELAEELSAAQEKAMMKQNFLDYLRRSFRGLPGSAEIRLAVRQSAGTYIPSLTVVNGGVSFSPGEALPPDLAVELTAEERPGGYLRVLLRLMDDRQTMALRTGQPVQASRNQPTLPLMDNVSRFEWRFFDSDSLRWENIWQSGRRPLMAELNVQLDDGQALRAVFWIPPLMPFDPFQIAPPNPDGSPNPDGNLNPDGNPSPDGT